MKSVLMVIQPEWCELIVSGKKTVEVRKTRPKIETPFKCYIYETKDKKFENIGFHYADGRKDFIHHIGKVIGEFVCDKVVEFENSMYDPAFKIMSILSCVNFVELALYLGGKDFGYGWHISDLLIYDNPRELSEFCITDNEAVKSCEHRKQSYHQFTDTGYIKNGFLCTDKFDWCTKCKTKLITKPPQSWCYVLESD